MKYSISSIVSIHLWPSVPDIPSLKITVAKIDTEVTVLDAVMSLVKYGTHIFNKSFEMSLEWTQQTAPNTNIYYSISNIINIQN